MNVHLHLVYNVAPLNHIEEKRKKFKTSRINESPYHFSFNTVLNLKRPQELIFSFRCVKNSFSRGKRSSFEIKTILSHFPGFWRLTYPFLFNNKVIFHFAGYVITTKLVCFAELTIKNALHFCGGNMQLLFAYNLYSFDIPFWVKFCTEKLENARRKLKK